MTEEEWQTCAVPPAMLEFLKGKATDRKLRLFAAACCRLFWGELDRQRCRKAVETAERYADGLATDQELNRARSLACEAAHGNVRYGSRRRYDYPFVESERRFFFATEAAHLHTPFLVGRLALVGVDPLLLTLSPGILRDIFGNPFRPVTLDPTWQTSTALTLARQMYDTRDFAPMRLLADALMDAGCDNEAVLTHLRGDGPHARGCWALDLVLGKG